MATKKKVYSIYDPDTPTARAQAKNPGGDVAQAVGTAATLPYRAIAEVAKRAPLVQVAEAAGNKIAEGRDNQNAFMATEGNRVERTALAAKYPDGRVVASNIPTPAGPAPIRDGISSTRLTPDMQQSFKRAMTAVSQPASATAPTPVARKALVDQYSKVGSVQRGGPQRVGNMDVTFAPGTSQAQRRAFMEAGAGRNPEGVTIDPDITAKYDRLHQEQYARRIAGGGMVPLYQSVRSPLPGAQTVETEAVDFANMTPAQRRFAVANEKIAAVRGNQAIERDRNNITAMGNEQTYQLGQGRNSLEARGQDLTAGVATERNRIDAAGVAVQDRATQSELEARDLDIQDKLRKSGYEKEYFDEKTTPERRIQLETMLGIRRKAEYGTLDQFDQEGIRNGQALYNKETGEVVTGAPSQAPQAAIDYLKKNPGEAENFKRKYGYLPF